MNYAKVAVIVVAALSISPTALSISPAELADVPPELRHHNWGPSCTHASLCTALEYHNQHELAQWWRNNNYGGQTIFDLMLLLDAAGIPYDYTIEADIDFLDRAVANRFPVILFHVPNHHCVNLVDLDSRFATILDNNSEWAYYKVTRDYLWNEWNFHWSTDERARNSSGWAIAVCLSPPPPWPALPSDDL